MVNVNFSSWSGQPIQANRPTYVITHGYRGSDRAQWSDSLAATIDRQDPGSNIFITDWSESANNFNYFNTVDDVDDVGDRMANWLQENKVNPDTTQLIGYSLGAHVSGIAGDTYEDITGRSIATIVGLDPAGVGYESSWFSRGKSPADRLDSTDAERVVAIHTSDFFGYDDPLGKLDLYVNEDSRFQPGKFGPAGNHSYAYELYTDLVGGNSYKQNSSDVFSDGKLDYQDIFALSGTVDVATTLG